MGNRDQILNDAEEAMRVSLDGHQAGMWTAMPGIVQDVNFVDMTCSVQPAIQGQVTDENGVTTNVNLPLLVKVPIVFPSAGGYTITFPLAAGDEVLVVFSSRCIDAWWQQGGIQLPIETRMHDLSDGFAIPGPKSVPKAIPGISSTALQIRNNAGTSYIELSADGIKLVGNVSVTGTLTASEDVVIGVTPAAVSLLEHTHTSAAPGNPTSPPIPF